MLTLPMEHEPMEHEPMEHEPMELQNPSLPMEHEPMELHSVSQSIDFGGMFNDAVFNDASIVDGHKRARTREEDLDQG